LEFEDVKWGSLKRSSPKKKKPKLRDGGGERIENEEKRKTGDVPNLTKPACGPGEKWKTKKGKEETVYMFKSPRKLIARKAPTSVRRRSQNRGGGRDLITNTSSDLGKFKERRRGV